MDGDEEFQPLRIGQQRAGQHPNVMRAGGEQRTGIAEMVISLGELAVIAVVDLA